MFDVFDVLLRGGWVADGTGAPPARADVAITGDRIAAVGRLDAAGAGTVADVSGRYVMPGFVDTHIHADALADTEQVQYAALRQGVTTLVLAGYADPGRPADGVDHVLVSGQFVLRDGALTGVRPGRALRRA